MNLARPGLYVFLAAPSTSRKGLKFVKQLRAQAAPFASIPTALDFLTGSRRGVGNENRGNRSLLLLTLGMAGGKRVEHKTVPGHTQ